MKKPLIVILLCICSIQMFYSQEDDGVVSLTLPIRNSLTFNRYAINPTFSFVREQTKYINITNKREWVQFDNAPLTYLVSYTGRFGENIGAGLGLFQQNYGVLTTFGGVLNFAYNAQLGRDSNLTFGLNIGAYKSGINTANIITNFDDPSLQNVPSNFLLTINPGINYGTEFFDFGASINNLALYNFTSSELIQDNPEQSIQAHIMYTGYIGNGGFFDNSKFSGLVRSEFQKEETIVSAIAMLTVPKGIWGQVGYNSLYGASGGIGLNITEQIAIEYNFETAIGDISAFGPSHEVTFAYRFKNDNNYRYSTEDEVSGILSSKNTRRRVAKVSRPKAKKPTVVSDRSAQAKEEEEAQAKRVAEQKVKEVEAAAAAAVAAEAKKIAEEKAKDEAQQRAQEKLEEDKKAKEVAEKRAEILSIQKAKQEAELKEKAELLAEEQAKELAIKKAEEASQADAQAKLLAEQKIKEEAETQAKLLADEKAKQLAEEQAKQLAIRKAQEDAEADTQAKLLAEQKAKEEVEAQAKLLADKKAKQEEQENARLLAEQKAKEVAEAQAKLEEELIANPTDDIGKSMAEAAKITEASRIEQDKLLKQFNDIITIKDEDLKDLKEENDLSDQGIATQPKAFKSISAENNKLNVIKSNLDNVIKVQGDKIKELNALYDERSKIAEYEMDDVNLFYKKEIKRLESEQLKAIATRTQLETKLETIKVATEFERRRRIKRANFDSEEDRYSQDRAVLNNIRQTTELSKIPFTASDFDHGENKTGSTRILKNVINVENGYYMIIAIHADKNKRDEFLTKVVASGRKNIDFFHDVNTSKYYIYYEKFNDLESANRALRNKGNRSYNGKMSIVKIENQ